MTKTQRGRNENDVKEETRSNLLLALFLPVDALQVVVSNSPEFRVCRKDIILSFESGEVDELFERTGKG